MAFQKNNLDLVSEENQQIVESDNAIQPMAVAFPYPIYFIPGIGQTALIGIVIVAGVTFKASSWIAKAVNSFFEN